MQREKTRVLAAFGHPDDEGQVTGTLAAYIAAGHQVTLVCGTRGEVGEISDPSLATPETLGWVRELELRASMAQVGLTDVRFLPHRDSGMDGTPENEDPDCLHQQPAELVVGELVEIIRDTRPNIVFTWDPNGGYGHPDHIAMHKHTVAAFDAAGDAQTYPSAGLVWSPQRLYWGARAMKTFASIWMEMEERGLLPEPMDKERRDQLEKALAEPDPVASLIVDTAEFQEARGAASSMHKSQFGENSMFSSIPDDLRQRFFGEERFFQARPKWPAGAEAETSPPWIEPGAGKPFFELRQCRCWPGQQENWVKYMHETVIPFQVSRGMVVTASWTSPEEDDLYVWIRRFDSEMERVRLYEAVYESDEWRNEIGPRVSDMLDRDRTKVTRLVATGASPSR